MPSESLTRRFLGVQAAQARELASRPAPAQESAQAKLARGLRISPSELRAVHRAAIKFEDDLRLIPRPPAASSPQSHPQAAPQIAAARRAESVLLRDTMRNLRQTVSRSSYSLLQAHIHTTYDHLPTSPASGGAR